VGPADVADRIGCRTFGHRWDDPLREFRSLYTSSSLHGAFTERLQDLRPKLDFLAGLQTIELEPGEDLPPYGSIDTAYFDNLYVCELVAETTKPFVDVMDREIIAIMRETHALLAQQLKQSSIDASTILGNARELTQAIARTIWQNSYAGIVAPSTLGQNYRNWTIFETGHQTNILCAELAVARAAPVTLDHPDLIEALNALHIDIDTKTLLLRADPQQLREPTPPDV
jgi:hypothetical protein